MQPESPITIRPYTPSDYSKLIVLYEKTGWFDKETDIEWRINRKSERDPASLLVAVQSENIVGSLSLLEDGRVAWFFRLVAMGGQSKEVIAQLIHHGGQILQERGYSEALVYSLTTDIEKHDIYRANGFQDGRMYLCSWINLNTLI